MSPHTGYNHTHDQLAIEKSLADGTADLLNPWVVYKDGVKVSAWLNFKAACCDAEKRGIMGYCTIRHLHQENEQISAIVLPSATDALVDERVTTHGDFGPGSKIWLDILNALYTKGSARYTSSQRMALCMIAMKLSRIANGNPNFADHWDDIAGYANLESRQLTKGK